MSLPFYNVGCSGCSYKEQYGFNVWYEFAGGRDVVCQPHLTQGWCKNCEKVLTIFSPQTEDTVKQDIKDLSEWIEEKKEEGTKKRLFIFKKKVDKEAIKSLKNGIKALEDCVAFFEAEQISLRCLTCESQNVSLVSLPDEYNQPVLAGVEHNCGGQIIITMRARVAYGNLPKVIYDIRGNILSDERCCFPKKIREGLPLRPIPSIKPLG